MPKVSVIVPTYNIQDYIEKGLNSLINQTLKDIEIICVDDCSTDHTPQILNEYAERDSRIKVILLEENGGVSKARNIGIKNAKGEYIGFMDSDDWVDNNFYEKLYSVAIKHNADVVKGSMSRFYNDSNKIIKSKRNNEIKKNKFIFYGEFYSAIYNINFLRKNNIIFPENVKTSEDVWFSLQIVLSCSKLYFSNAIYYYLQRPNSKVRKFNSETINSIYNGAEFILKKINNSDIPKYQYKFIIFSIIMDTIINRCNKVNLSREKTLEICLEFIERLLPNIKYRFKELNDLNCKKLCKLLYKQKLSIFELIFSIKNDSNKKHKIITILGIKVKIKRKSKNK